VGFVKRLTIVTPEGVDVDLVLAGVGSRFIAGLLDIAIQAAALVAVLVAFGVTNTDVNGWGLAVFLVMLFLILFGYDVLWETLNQGRTPGKLAVGLRVERIDGGPVGFRGSAVRNLLRIPDGFGLLTFFLAPVGIITVASTRCSQRLGDLAAGTVVVRERVPAGVLVLAPGWSDPNGAHLTWDVSRVDTADLGVVRSFLARRSTLEPHARWHLANQLAQRLQPVVAGSDPSWPAEAFLEGLVAAKTARA
jgi:uncharacterized RDD family membrane protein YckC